MRLQRGQRGCVVRRWRDIVGQVALAPARRCLDRVERGDWRAKRDVVPRGVENLQLRERKNEIVSFVSSGLRDLSVSRTTFDWGIRDKDGYYFILGQIGRASCRERV